MRHRLASSYAASAQSAYFDVLLVEVWHHQLWMQMIYFIGLGRA
jgi:hypothetical protein